MKDGIRYLEAPIREDLAEKMVLLSGPRQVGKTTLARRLLREHGGRGYLNWDIAEHREQILKRQLPSCTLWVFDEIHKYRGWRNYLKGLYDGRSESQQILVTGSARLEWYRYGGDSLQGRYHMWHLHGLSVAELGMRSHADLQALVELGGFPEPFFSGSARKAKRWSREYRSLLLREEVTSLERIHDLGALELLMLRLPELVGSPLSLNALREDLQVAHKTIAHWIAILERLYALFRIAPFGASKLRAIKKAQKHYHYDWTAIEHASGRFENVVASHLLKWTQMQQDDQGRDLELRYFRDIDGREVDFIVTERRKPILAVECKLADDEPSPHLRYFKERFPACDAWQIAQDGKRDFVTRERLRVAPALTLLRTLT